MFKKKNSSHSDVVLDTHRIIAEDTPFAIREAYRSLYTNIIYLPIESKCKKLVLTSAFPGEGKTSVSINLAYTIASSNPEVKILLVDSDMRSPRVTALLNIESKGLHGLSEFLAGIDEKPNIIPSIYPNLSILPSGAENVNAPGLISSSKMLSLIKLCDESYDYVIFDTPPINVVPDALLLSDHTDGYILIARADYSDVNSMSEAVSSLERVNANILGIVLCSLNTKRTKKYGRYSKHYSSYSRYSGCEKDED